MFEEIYHVLVTLFVSRIIIAVILRWEGRRWWCKCQRMTLWESDVNSYHCSQHLADPYSFTHILHGVIFFFPLSWLLSRWVPFHWRLVITVIIEGIWEVVENSEFVVGKYRKETVSQGYIGDSVGNSIGDTLCCGLGFFIAHFLGFKWSAIYYAITEVALLFTIHDNLTLNIIMLIHPIPAVKQWQQKRIEADKKKQQINKNSKVDFRS